MDSDLYAVLGVGRDATQEELRRAYRRKALELHPDRNGGSPEAEEAFKAVTGAYAVLGDPARRAAYDARGPAGVEFAPGDVFADLFTHPAFGPLFAQLAREFQGQGLRFDEAYLDRVFQGRRGGVLFGGFVFAGPLGDLFSRRPSQASRPGADGPDPASLPRRPGFLARLLRSALPAPPRPVGESRDVRYTLPVPPAVLSQGGAVSVCVPGPAGTETYRVRIPAGAAPGTRLRLPGKGAGTAERGDLYLELRADGAG